MIVTRKQQKLQHTQHRRGSVLVFVLVVLLIISLSVLRHVTATTQEARFSQAMLSATRAQLAAESAIDRELTRYRNASMEDTRGSTSRNRDGQVNSAVIHQEVDGDEGVVVRGPLNESSKINLNTLGMTGLNPELERQQLIHLPGMTPQLADSILDWIDPDEAPRPFGAEVSYYTSRDSTYTPPNRALTKIEEILNVKGITGEMVFGKDRNQDGWVDRLEQTGRSDFGPLGWRAYLTVRSAESDLNEAGQPRIDVNQDSLAQLYDELVPRLGERAAQFIVAFRMYGSEALNEEMIDQPEKTAEEKLLDAQRRLKDQLGETTPKSSLQSPQTRGGLELTPDPPFRIRSWYDLIGTTVEVYASREQRFLDSPWGEDVASIQRAVNLLRSECTLQAGKRATGRIDLRSATEPALMSIPGMTRSLARQIISMQKPPYEPVTPLLVQEGLVSLKQLRSVAPYLTDDGSVVTGMAVGWMNQHRAAARIQFAGDFMDFEIQRKIQSHLPLNEFIKTVRE